MTDSASIEAALAPIAAGRAVVRLREDRCDIILDVTGLAPDVRDALEADVRSAAQDATGGDAVRVVQTSSRPKRRLIAVASGKGGVGKSTVSANLAVALARSGIRTGLVDADIYGPSQPTLMGVEGIRPQAREKTLIPVESDYGVPLLSLGQLVAPDQAIAWRGPMAGSALAQLVDADWGDTETLILDLPPGTGDVQLTMLQKFRPAGAVIVSTPQDLSLIDAKRAINLFEQMKVPIVGLVENMAGFACPNCGEISDPFGRGGAEAAAQAMSMPFLGRIPLDISIREMSDAGTPIAAGDDAKGQAFRDIGAKVAAWCEAHKG